MDIKDYAKNLSQCVREIIDFDAEVSVVPVIKNNGVEKTAIVIREENVKISPTIYLDDYYKNYADANNLEYTAKQIISTYNRWKIEGEIDVKKYTQFDSVKDDIIFKLVNKERNEARLKDAPTVDWLDLIICFYIRTSDERFGEGVILVNNELLKLWGISVAELYGLALTNTPRILPEKKMTFLDVFKRMSGFDEQDFCQEIMEFGGNSGMFILSNSSEIFGASVIVYSKLIEEIAEEFEDDLVIIPSSVHEIIVVLRNYANDYIDDVCDIIEYVNSTCVSDEDVLANHAYYYRREDRRILTCPRVYDGLN